MPNGSRTSRAGRRTGCRRAPPGSAPRRPAHDGSACRRHPHRRTGMRERPRARPRLRRHHDERVADAELHGPPGRGIAGRVEHSPQELNGPGRVIDEHARRHAVISVRRVLVRCHARVSHDAARTPRMPLRAFDPGGVAAYEFVVDAPAGGDDGAPAPPRRRARCAGAAGRRARRRLRLNCRSVSTTTTRPEGRWVARTAVLALFRCWPPGPPVRQATMSTSASRERRGAGRRRSARLGDDVPVLPAGAGPVRAGGLPAQRAGPRGGERLGVGAGDLDQDRPVGAGPVTGHGLDPLGRQASPGGVGLQPVQQPGQRPGALLRPAPGRQQQVNASLAGLAGRRCVPRGRRSWRRTRGRASCR